MRQLGELRLIDEIVRPRFPAPAGYVGIGDDSAFLPLGDGRLLAASTDRVPADFLALRHGAIDHRALGRYLVALNVSDLAASGAKPLGLLLNLAIPADFAIAQIEELLDGVAEGAQRWGCPVVGGDTSDSSELGLAATAIGIVADGQHLTRSGARPGDLVFVSEPVGAGAAVLALLLDDSLKAIHPQWRTWSAEHFESMRPAMHLSAALGRSGRCTSCIDNTDGLAVSLRHLAAASQVAIRLDVAGMPLDERSEVVFGGDVQGRLRALEAGVDLTLVGTIRPEQVDRALSDGILTIGVVLDGKGVSYVGDDDREHPVEVRGWEYFRPG